MRKTYLDKLLKVMDGARVMCGGMGEISFRYDNIVFCGLGGSAMPGEIVSDLDFDKPVFNARSYLPKWAGKKTLCFIISYSGNTKETLDLYEKAKRKDCNIVIITSGGKLSKKKSRKIKKKVIVPKGYEPREALPYQLFPILTILGINFGTTKKEDGRQADSTAKKVVKRIKDKLPRIYVADERMRSIAYRWQTQINENAKKLAHSHFFPELAHNEIEAREGKAILLRDSKNVERPVSKAIDILKPIEIKLKNDKLIDKILYGILIGDLVSYYLAEMRGYDYLSTERIDKLKG